MPGCLTRLLLPPPSGRALAVAREGIAMGGDAAWLAAAEGGTPKLKVTLGAACVVSPVLNITMG